MRLISSDHSTHLREGRLAPGGRNQWRRERDPALEAGLDIMVLYRSTYHGNRRLPPAS